MAIKNLNVIAISRDWSKFQHKIKGHKYPPSPVTVFSIPLWSSEDQKMFIEDRVMLHQEAEAEFLINGTLPECTDEERWKKEDTYRVVKQGRKSAVRVLYSQWQAKKYIKDHKDKENLSIEIEVGEYVRCESYCPVSQFCEQHKNTITGKGEKA
tara:strand:- start:4374 stop:4835 length:462 start_codon:yes stop_codon:yes gene_type:complete